MLKKKERGEGWWWWWLGGVGGAGGGVWLSGTRCRAVGKRRGRSTDCDLLSLFPWLMAK